MTVTVNRYKGQEKYFPLYDKEKIFRLDDNGCNNILFLTDRELYFIKHSLGKHTAYALYKRRWYAGHSGIMYNGISDDDFDNQVVPFVKKLLNKMEISEIMCTNAILDGLLAQATSMANSQASIKASLELIVKQGDSQLVSVADLITVLQDGQDSALAGALDFALKIRELLGILPGFDLKLSPIDIITGIMTFRRDRFIITALERMSSSLVAMSIAQGGNELAGLIEAGYEALPGSDTLDEFTAFPTEAGDLIKFLLSLVTKSQIEATTEIAEALKKCCEKDKSNEVITASEYPSVSGNAHKYFCRMLATLVGRCKAILTNVQYNITNGVPTGTTNEEKVLNAIRTVYGTDYNVGGEGYKTLLMLAQNQGVLNGFVSMFSSIIPNIMMTANCKGTPNELMSGIRVAMGVSYFSYFNVFLLVMPPNSVVSVFNGTYDVVELYYQLYASGCNCGDSSLYSYPIIKMWVNPDYNKIEAGQQSPYSAYNITSDGYKINFINTNEVIFVGNRVVSDEENLFLSVGFNGGTQIYEPPYPEYEVLVECGGVGQSVGSLVVQGDYPVGLTLSPFRVPVTGVPTIKIRQIEDYGYFHYLSDIILTDIGS